MKRAKKNTRRKIYLISKIINIISLISIIILSVIIWKWNQDNKKSENIMKNVLKDKNEISNDIVSKEEVGYINFNKLIETNSDTIGWIQVFGTEINYPVVQTNDNQFYLTHTFDKSYNKTGWIFADYNNKNLKNNELDKNTIIYGHNRENDSMFGTLSNVLTKEWREDNSNTLINFSTIDKEMKWQVFSTYTIESEDNYIRTKFSSDNEYIKFLNMIKKRSIHNFDIDVSKNDNILTLSTCTNIGEGRIVVHAKLIK